MAGRCPRRMSSAATAAGWRSCRWCRASRPARSSAGSARTAVPRKLLLLDRDGTLMTDSGSPHDPAAVDLVPGAAAAVKALAGYGFTPVVVSNQSGVGRGLITREQAYAVHRRFIDLFRDATGLTLPAYYCPHAPED